LTARRALDGRVAEEEFAAAMAALGPFEHGPRLAVAVSGGADSMALLLLAHEWAVARQGQVAALTVDHGLRPEAIGEANQVAQWALAQGIAHQTLCWTGAKPRGDVQAAARAARYRLLERWCGEAGVFHLLLAHHQDDQAETFLLRLARGSGLDGLAAMAPLAERPSCRLLRPLLAVPHARLLATLEARGQAWLEDPSNRNEKFARARVRRNGVILAREGLSAARLAATARRLARARQALELPLASLLARAATPDPAGFIRFDPAPLIAAPEELGLRALAAVLMTVGGADYSPRLERLERLYREIMTGVTRGRTLAGCRIVPHRGALLVCREAKAVAAPVPARPGAQVDWDGRFSVRLPSDAPSDVTVGALGMAKVNESKRVLPAAARIAIAALRDNRGIVAVPALGYRRGGEGDGSSAPEAVLLRTSRPATGAGIKVV
jgi:tRNA(Ile)-lysidine synthase